MSKNMSKRVMLVFLGQLFISIGISLLFVANLGVDPLGVFHTGVANALNITFQKAFFIENLIAIIIIFIVDRKYLNVATLMTLFVVSLTSGFIMSFFYYVLGTDPSMVVRIICLFASCVSLSLGLNIYVLANLGVGALDAMAEMISDKFHFEYQKVKVISDLGFLAVGYILGGAVGVGTIVAALIVGPIIQFIRKRIKDPIDKFITA